MNTIIKKRRETVIPHLLLIERVEDQINDNGTNINSSTKTLTMTSERFFFVSSSLSLRTHIDQANHVATDSPYSPPPHCRFLDECQRRVGRILLGNLTAVSICWSEMPVFFLSFDRTHVVQTIALKTS